MCYDIHDRVCNTVDSHKYYVFFADSHMFYYLKYAMYYGSDSESYKFYVTCCICTTVYYSTK